MDRNVVWIGKIRKTIEQKDHHGINPQSIFYLPEMVTSFIIHLRRLDGGMLSGLRNTDRKRVTFRSPAKKRGFSGCILE